MSGDPQRIAEWVLTQDLADAAAKCWERKNRTPAELFRDLTPSHFVLIFCPRPGRVGGADFDRVKALQSANDARAGRGLPPAVPNWL